VKFMRNVGRCFYFFPKNKSHTDVPYISLKETDVY